MLTLIIFLVALWFILSGYLTFLPLVPGLIAIFFIVIIYYHFRSKLAFVKFFRVKNIKFILYLPYLLKEIILANLAVAKIILFKKPTPKFTQIKNNLSSRFTISTFANSITLTPGTITVDVQEDYLLIHMLDSTSEPSLHNSIMEQKLQAMEKN